MTRYAIAGCPTMLAPNLSASPVAVAVIHLLISPFPSQTYDSETWQAQGNLVQWEAVAPDDFDTKNLNPGFTAAGDGTIKRVAPVKIILARTIFAAVNPDACPRATVDHIDGNRL